MNERFTELVLKLVDEHKNELIEQMGQFEMLPPHPPHTECWIGHLTTTGRISMTVTGHDMR